MSERLYQALLCTVRAHRAEHASRSGCGSAGERVAAWRAWNAAVGVLAAAECVRVAEFRADLRANTPLPGATPPPGWRPA